LPVAGGTPVVQCSKTAAILDLISRGGGGTVKDLIAATDWLPHSVRGFVSNLVRKDAQRVDAIKLKSGEGAYHLAAGQWGPTSDLRHQPPPGNGRRGSSCCTYTGQSVRQFRNRRNAPAGFQPTTP